MCIFGILHVRDTREEKQNWVSESATLSSSPLKMVHEIVIDAKDHLLGRLASIVAKQLLEGRHIACVRTEGLCQSGKFIRNKCMFWSET